MTKKLDNEPTNNVKLTPCPCRNGDTLEIKEITDGFYIQCSACGCRGPIMSTLEAVTTEWNFNTI